MRKSRGRREGEKEESSGKVKLEEMGEMASGGVGGKGSGKGGGKGKEERIKRKRRNVCGG